MKRSFIESFERELLKESVWPELDKTDLENSSSYIIQVESNGKVQKSQEKNGILPVDALDEILDFINELTPEEKQNVGLSWFWDDEKWGYSGGDLIVAVYGPEEIAEWPEEDREDKDNWTITEWVFAERQIRRALGLPRKHY